MSAAPIALGRASLPPSPPFGARDPAAAAEARAQASSGANSMTASSPGHRLPVVDKSQVDPETLRAAQGMEAMFLDYMLQVMRHTVPKNEFDLESPATDIYRGMQDQQYAEKAAHAGGIGLADQIVAYLEAQRYTVPRGQGVPSSPPQQSGFASREARGKERP